MSQLPSAVEPALDRAERDLELLGDLGTRHAAVDRVQNPDPQILGVGFHHRSVPSGPTPLQTAVVWRFVHPSLENSSTRVSTRKPICNRCRPNWVKINANKT